MSSYISNTVGDVVGGRRTWRTLLAGAALQYAVNRRTSASINLPGRDPNVVYKNINNMPPIKSKGVNPNRMVYTSKNRQLVPLGTFGKLTAKRRKVGRTDIAPYRKKYRISNTTVSAGKLKMKKRYKKSYKTRAQSKGNVATSEVIRNISTTQEVVYIGHHTHPLEFTRFQMWTGILKRFLAEMKVFPYSVEDPLITDFGFVAGDIIRCKYEQTPTPGAALTYDYTIAVGNTFNSLIGAFGNASRPWFTVTESGQPNLDQLIFIPSATSPYPRVTMDLRNTYISIIGVSHLKMQNRTINTVGSTEADEVDNMPLYGKSYQVKSNQAHIAAASMNNIQSDFVTDGSGLAVETSSTGGGLPQEPPQPSFWRGVKGSGKIHLDPGQLKTSVVKAVVKGNVNSVLWKINGISNYTLPGSARRLNWGKMNFFALEKMINSDSTRPILVSVEMNSSMYTTVRYKKQIGMKPVHATFTYP